MDQPLEVQYSGELKDNSRIHLYFQKRLTNESVYKASRLARTLPTEQKEEYQAGMIKTADDIIRLFKIDEVLFADPRYEEAFFAFCDSWFNNETHKDHSDYEKEKSYTSFKTTTEC